MGVVPRQLIIYKGKDEPRDRKSFLWLHTNSHGRLVLEDFNGEFWTVISGASSIYELGDVNSNGAAVLRTDGTPARAGDVLSYSLEKNKWFAFPQEELEPDESIYARTNWVLKNLKEYMKIVDLLENGLIKSSLLPSFIDEIIELPSKSDFPVEGSPNKIYVALDTGKSYRWSGSQYTEISESLALGETSGTAYEGSKGKANADAISALQELLSSGFVSAIGGKSGDIILVNGQSEDGMINLTISDDNKLQAFIVGLKALAFKDSVDFSDILGKIDSSQLPGLDASIIESGVFDIDRIPKIPWSNILDTPTTLRDYGITDVYTKAEVANIYARKDQLQYADKTYEFTQGEASSDWTVVHNMDKYPSVSVVDSAGTLVVGDVEYINKNALIIHFSAEFSGKVYLN